VVCVAAELKEINVDKALPPPMEDSKDLHEESPFCSPLFYLCVLCVRDSQSEQHNEGV